MWVTAKKKAKTDQGPTRVEISHERRQESRSAAHSIKSPEGRRRMDTSPVTIQRRQVGREIIQAAESLLSPPLSLTSPTSGGLAFFSPSSRGPITSPINTRRAGARTAVRFSCTPPLSPFGDFSTATIVFDAKQRAAVQEKSDRVMKVQRIRDQFEERKRRNSSIQRAEEEQGLWNQFWDVLDDVEADRAHREEEEEDAEDVGELLSRLSSGLLDEVLNEKCGGESFHLTKCASGALQLMQLKDRFKRYHDEALEEEEEELAQLGCAGTSPVVGSGCFEDNDFFRNLLQVRERSVSLSSTPPLLFSI